MDVNDEKTRGRNARATILIVDDDDSLRRVLEFQLREDGYEVLTAADEGVRFFV